MDDKYATYLSSFIISTLIIGRNKDESSDVDGTLTRYESLHMGHFEKMMSENCAKDSAGKIINSKC